MDVLITATVFGIHVTSNKYTYKHNLGKIPKESGLEQLKKILRCIKPDDNVYFLDAGFFYTDTTLNSIKPKCKEFTIYRNFSCSITLQQFLTLKDLPFKFGYAVTPKILTLTPKYKCCELEFIRMAWDYNADSNRMLISLKKWLKLTLNNLGCLYFSNNGYFFDSELSLITQSREEIEAFVAIKEV